LVTVVLTMQLLSCNFISLAFEPQLELYNYDREVNSFEVWEQYVSAECTDTHISFGIAPDTEVLKGYFKERAELIFNPGRTNESARCSTNASNASQIQFSVLREECELPQDNQVQFLAINNKSLFELTFPFKCGDYEPSYMEVNQLNGEPLSENASLQIGFTINISIFHRRKKHLSECWMESNARRGIGRRRRYFLRKGYSEVDEFGDNKCRVHEVEDIKTVSYNGTDASHKSRTRKRFEVSLRVGWSALPEGRPDPVQATTIYPLFIRCELSDANAQLLDEHLVTDEQTTLSFGPFGVEVPMFYLITDECLSRCPYQRTIAYSKLLRRSKQLDIPKGVRLLDAIAISFASFFLGSACVLLIFLVPNLVKRRRQPNVNPANDRLMLINT
uniref:ZP domain-containing protein n=2 Tax=Parascaris univalens TaxID=6257 RepID=A0A915BAZ9_PARUN